MWGGWFAIVTLACPCMRGEDKRMGRRWHMSEFTVITQAEAVTRMQAHGQCKNLK